MVTFQSQIIEPEEKDKGMYSVVITNSENSHKRSLELSGEGQSLYDINIPWGIVIYFNLFKHHSPSVRTLYSAFTLPNLLWLI